MADNKVLLELEIVQKGKSISIVQKETEKLKKSQDRLADSSKKSTKQQEKGYGRQKQGLIQTANSTKNFSKLANTIDGGGGGTSLVGAYATLAANVFAATAAFNALARAAEFQQLQQGLEIIGNQSGRTLSVLAEGLREATNGALSLEQASRGAALGVSGGFGGAELEGLAEIAKGASIALGRDMADAFDRLTRGAIKLEPEILDELGIMVRLDDAVEQYAAQLNKSAGSLSQLERRQAFMNAILVQGSAKFGDISEKADPTAFQKLGATFGDLTREIFTFINETLRLNTVVDFLAGSTTALLGTMIAFGSTIATQIVPALGQFSTRAFAAAAASRDVAKEALEFADESVVAARSAVGAFEGGTKGFQLLNKKIADGSASTKDFDDTLRRLRISETKRAKALATTDAKNLAAKEAQLKQIKRQIALTEELKLAQVGQSTAQLQATRSEIAADFAEQQAENVRAFSDGELGLAAAITASNANIDSKNKKLKKLSKTNKKSTGITRLFVAANTALAVSFAKISANIKLLALQFVKFLPIIGAVLVAVGAAIVIFDRIFNTEEAKAYRKAIEDLDTILGKLPEKVEEYQKAMASATSNAQMQIRAFTIISNSIKEINDQLIKTRKLRAEAGGDVAGFGISGRERDRDIFGRISNLDVGEERAVSFDDILGAGGEQIYSRTGPTAAGIADLKQDLRNAFAVDDTEEFKSLKGLMNSELPGLAEALRGELTKQGVFNNDKGTGLFDIDGDLTEKQANVILDKVASSIANVQSNFAGLGDSVKTFSAELQNTEKIASQFTQKFFPKTSATDIIDSFNSLKRGLVEIQSEVEKAGLGKEGSDTNIAALGTALSESGENVKKLLGAELGNDMTELAKVQGRITALSEKENLTGFERIELRVKERQEAEILEKLGTDGVEKLETTLQLLKDIQRSEIERKNNLQRIATIQKSVTKATKVSSAAITADVALSKQKLAIDQNALQDQLKIVANAVDVTTEDKTQAELKADLLAKAKELNTEGKNAKEVAAINLQLATLERLELEEQLSLATEKHRIDQAEAQLDKQSAARRQKNFDLAKREFDLSERQASRRFGEGGGGELATALRLRETEEERKAIATDRINAEIKLVKAQAEILKAELSVLAERSKDETTRANLLAIIPEIDKNTTAAVDVLNRELDVTIAEIGDSFTQVIDKIFEKSSALVTLTDNMVLLATRANDLSTITGTGEEGEVTDEDKAVNRAEKVKFSLNVIDKAFTDFGTRIEEMFGEDGAVISALSNFIGILANIAINVPESFAKIDESLDGNSAKMAKFAVVAESVSSVISGFSAILQADAQRREKIIDDQINAEKAMDGKSKESVGKIAALEKKKEAMAKKSFETNKKLQIANAVISTAAAVAGTYASMTKINPFLATALAVMMGALGMAQVAIIKKQQYSGGTADVTPAQTSLSIGKASNAVDVSQSATGGELNYLRGGRTSGSDMGGAGAYLPGSAMGKRGYAMGGDGIVVGERGPEVINPAAPVDIVPNFALGGGSTNVNFSINAIDSAGVEDVLTNQRGNIIRMIREAANENGERFLETIDTQTYGSSS